MARSCHQVVDELFFGGTIYCFRHQAHSLDQGLHRSFYRPRLGDPARALQMRDQWKIATAALAEAVASATPSASPLEQANAAIETLRKLAGAPKPTRENE